MGGLSPPEDLADFVGSVVADKYVVEDCIGLGGMAAVFRGRHEALGRAIAIKVLRPEYRDHAEAAARFEREARMASALEHPNCVEVFDCGITARGLRFMLMPLLQGAELSTVLGTPMAVPLALERSRQLLRGLEYVHARGIVHRDIKPENIFVVKDHEGAEVLRIVDFGIAKLVSESAPSDGVHTQAGIVVGTPGYISPEQAMGLDVDPRTDLYAVGIVMYEMLAGRVPFAAESPRELLRQQVQDPPPPLPDRVPAPLSEMVMALLAKHPEARPASASEALARLDPPMSAPDPVVTNATVEVPAVGEPLDASVESASARAPAVRPTAVEPGAGTYMFVPKRGRRG